MKEVWKDISEYEGLYQVSNYGNVRSLNYRRTGKAKQLSKTIDSDGYLHVRLYKNGVSTPTTVHALVANAFIQNPDNKPQINHIDGNKSNNHMSNLEWCTCKENVVHAFKSNLTSKKGVLNPRKRPILQYDLNGNFIKKWSYMREAAEQLGVNVGNISLACSGKYHHAYGYIWKYEDCPSCQSQK